MTAAERGTQEDRRPSALGWPEPVSRETSNGAPAAEANVSRETATSAATRQPRPAAPGEPWPRPASRRIITTANQKGGVGKTTTAVNVAAAMSQHGLRVLVIDLDPQGNASTAFDVPHQSGAPSSYDVLVEGRPLTDVAVEVDGLPGLCCVPATIDLAGAEIELVSVVAREFRLRRAIEALDDRFDYVFLDCPPSLGLLTLNAMVGAAEVMIPIQCEFYALEGLSQLLANIDLVKAELNPRLRVSTIVLTMYDGRTRLADQVVAEVRGHFGPLVVDTIVPRSVRVSEAPGFGQPVISFDPGSRGARAYAAVAHEIVQQDLTQEVAR